MGFFGKFLEEANKVLEEGKKVVQEVATEENKEKAKEFFNTLGEKLGDVAGDLKQKMDDLGVDLKDFKKEEETHYEEDYFDEELPEDNIDARVKILDVLKNDFPQYEVREDVSPTTIGGTGRFMNYSIAVYDQGAMKLAIMLIGKTTTSHREYRWSREEAEKNGIIFLNFVRHYPNRVEYIRERLHKYL